MIGEGETDDPLLSSSSVGNSEPGALAIPDPAPESVGNLEEAEPGSVGNYSAPPPQDSSVGNLESAALAISEQDPGRVGNLEDDLDFAPASVGNLASLEIRSNWRWEFRMRKTVFGIYILERGKDRTPVMYLGPMSPDPKSREYWRQFLPEYEKWSQNGFKRRVKYSRPISRLSDVMV